MKTYIADIIPKIQRYSQKLDNLTLLTNQHWVVLDELTNSKVVFIFRGNNELLVSRDGKVEKGKWEYLGNNSILIDLKDGSYLFRQGFFDENVLALKVDSKEEYAFLINENKYDGELNSVERAVGFLNGKYLVAPTVELKEPGSRKGNPEIRLVYEKSGSEWIDGLIIGIALLSLLVLVGHWASKNN